MIDPSGKMHFKETWRRKKELQRKNHMEFKIQFKPSIERQENIKPEEKQRTFEKKKHLNIWRKNIWKEAIYTWPLKAISRSSESNLGRVRMEKAKFL